MPNTSDQIWERNKRKHLEKKTTMSEYEKGYEQAISDSENMVRRKVVNESHSFRDGYYAGCRAMEYG